MPTRCPSTHSEGHQELIEADASAAILVEVLEKFIGLGLAHVHSVVSQTADQLVLTESLVTVVVVGLECPDRNECSCMIN